MLLPGLKTTAMKSKSIFSAILLTACTAHAVTKDDATSPLPRTFLAPHVAVETETLGDPHLHSQAAEFRSNLQTTLSEERPVHPIARARRLSNHQPIDRMHKKISMKQSSHNKVAAEETSNRLKPLTDQLLKNEQTNKSRNTLDVHDKQMTETSWTSDLAMKDLSTLFRSEEKEHRVLQDFCDLALDFMVQHAPSMLWSDETKCECASTATEVEIICARDSFCVEHTDGDNSQYTGDLEMYVYANTELLVDYLCFDYDDAPQACLINRLSEDTCAVTVGGDQCASCSMCMQDSLYVSFSCGRTSANECRGDSLEGTPLQFWNYDTQECASPPPEDDPEIDVLEICEDLLSALTLPGTCGCSANGNVFALQCFVDDYCIEFTTGDESTVSGDFVLTIVGDYSDPDTPRIGDSWCFDYSRGSIACLSSLLVGNADCSILDGSTECASCSVCDRDELLVSFRCDGKRTNQCRGDSLEDTPLEFLAIEDVRSCNSARPKTVKQVLQDHNIQIVDVRAAIRAIADLEISGRSTHPGLKNPEADLGRSIDNPVTKDAGHGTSSSAFVVSANSVMLMTIALAFILVK